MTSVLLVGGERDGEVLNVLGMPAGLQPLRLATRDGVTSVSGCGPDWTLDELAAAHALEGVSIVEYVFDHRASTREFQQGYELVYRAH